MTTRTHLALAILFAGVALQVAAHDAWIDSRDGGLRILYGHDEKIETVPAAKVKAVNAIDAKGSALSVSVDYGAGPARLAVAGQPALLTLHYDNGYWSKTTEGSKNLPKNEVPGAISASHSVKYGKTVLAWSMAVGKPQGLRLEIVPLTAAAPTTGKTLPVQVLWEGKPLAGAKIVRSEYSKEKPVEADAEGKAEIPVASGRQTLSVSHKIDLPNDPLADTYAASTNLVFEAR